MFQALNVEELFDEVVDVIIELMYVYNDFEKDGGVIQIVIPQVFALQDRYRAAAEEGGAGEDEDVARGLCRIFTHMAESFLQVNNLLTPLNNPLTPHLHTHGRVFSAGKKKRGGYYLKGG